MSWESLNETEAPRASIVVLGMEDGVTRHHDYNERKMLLSQFKDGSHLKGTYICFLKGLLIYFLHIVSFPESNNCTEKVARQSMQS